MAQWRPTVPDTVWQSQLCCQFIPVSNGGIVEKKKIRHREHFPSDQHYKRHICVSVDWAYHLCIKNSKSRCEWMSPDWNISATIQWIVRKFCADIHGSQPSWSWLNITNTLKHYVYCLWLLSTAGDISPSSDHGCPMCLYYLPVVQYHFLPDMEMHVRGTLKVVRLSVMLMPADSYVCVS